jgi:3-oxoacyl-[acyl-carrier-protein] synthase II
MGVVTPIGIGTRNFWDGLVAGKSGARTNDLFDSKDIASHVVSPVDNFSPEDYLDRKQARHTDRFVHFAVAATLMAREDSGITVNANNAERVGVYVGTGVGGMNTMIEGYRTIYQRGMGKVSPFMMQAMLPNMAAGFIARLVGAQGPSEACIAACASSTHSIGDAYTAIKRGEIDIAFAGGTEAALNPISVASFSNMRGITRRNDDPTAASRPFDRDRDGFVPAEGAGMLVLESLEHALGRGARIYGSIVGYGASNDAYDMVHPSPGGTGAALSISNAIRSSGLDCTAIEYINPHATSTPAGDAAENDAIKRVFGDHAYNLSISATKSMTGHMIGAAGAVEAICTLMAMCEGVLPPTINLHNPDDGCDLDYVPLVAKHRQVSYAISNSFGFGGHNATIVLGRYEEK